MNIIQAIILGIIQGITEFIPVSSSGHLVIIPYLFGWQLEETYSFAFGVLVQIGTLISLIIYYREDLLTIGQSISNGIRKRRLLEDEAARVGIFALIATIPAAIMGLLLKQQIESSFNNPEITPFFLIGTSILLIIAEFAGKKERKIKKLGIYDALWIGIFQILSLFPGVSRSGSTIAGGMTRNFTRKTSGQFSFLMAIPILAAAGVVGFIELLQVPDLSSFLPVMVAGMVTSSVVGYFAIRWLLRFLNGRSILPFAGYCLMIASITLLFIHADLPPSLDFPILNKNEKKEIYFASYDPEIMWLVPIMNTCSQEILEDDMLIRQSAWDETILENEDVHLAIGEVIAAEYQIYLLGYDQIVPVVAESHPFNSTSINLLKDIFSGKITTWSDVYENCQLCFSSNPVNLEFPVSIWIYPQNSLIRKEIEENYLDRVSISTYTSLAPNSDFMRRSIASSDEAIGFIPRGWIDATLKEINIININQNINLPILAISRNQLNGKLQSWVQ